MAAAPIIMMAIAAASAAMSAMSAIRQGEQQSNLADYNAQVERNNAQQATQAAEANAQRSNTRAAAVMAAQKANFAAGGVDVGAGSPLDVMSDTAAQTKLDALTIRYGGAVAATRAGSQATLDTLQGSNAIDNSQLTAGTTLLGGAAKAYGVYAGSSGPLTLPVGQGAGAYPGETGGY